MITREMMIVLNDPAASNWLKRALVEATARDAVDAVCDAECLARLLAERLALLHAKATTGKLVPRIDLQAAAPPPGALARRLWP
jgi:hypothetical protein